ncbi:MAG: DsbA family oxidoreductase [Gammaproteobacteria bacterium]|nr:DsbA family oxidoreductase [Gammaproteobacteria bacterium]
MEIEIFSDVVCPWCYIGKKRLDAVMDTPVGEGVTLRWRPYQLYPNMPPDGMDRARYLEARYGADADRGRVPERIEAEAGEVGVKLDFSAIEKMPNTFQAHRLLDLAAAHGVQHELAEVLFDYYFCSGRDVGDLDVLVEAAETLGLERDPVRDYLAGTEGADAVREQLERAVDVGVSGVPCYLLAGRFALPGAQAPEVMAQFITRAKSLVA